MSNDKGSFHGPLRANPCNSRYFTDGTGRAVYLTGSHTWANLVDVKDQGAPDFDYDEYLDFMEVHHHNFMRMWAWHHPERVGWTDARVVMDPLPYVRTGPGLAFDGLPRFDLGRHNPVYFDRLRERVIAAGERGIYVSVMLFEGWCTSYGTPGTPGHCWPYHPYNVQNNINGVDGDSDGNGRAKLYSLEVPAAVKFEKAFIRQVIDTVNDLDNVLYEIINELRDGGLGLAWQSHMVDYIHEYERTKPKQHPVGITGEGGNQHNPDLFATPADWISPGRGPDSEYKYNPPAADGSKVILADTDHLWGHGGTYQWVWKSFLRGLNPIFMDPWGPLAGWGDYARARGDRGALNTRSYRDWGLIRTSMGNTLKFAERLDLNTMVPHGELASSGYCLADPGEAYLVYVPDDGQVTVDLSAARNEMLVEWFNPRTGESVTSGSMSGGQPWMLVSPFGLDVVLYIRARP